MTAIIKETMITSPYYWRYDKNPNLAIIQVDPLSDIDSELVEKFKKQNVSYRIVVVDKIPLLHLSNHYPRLSSSEYLRSLLPANDIENIQHAVNNDNGENIPDTMAGRYKLAYTVIKTLPQMVECLMTVDECLERERLDCELAPMINIYPGFIDTIVARLYNTLATHFYANGDVTEAMVAQSIINYKNITASNTATGNNHRKLCKLLTSRIEPYLTTKIPTLILLDSSHFNHFIEDSCADRLVSKYGKFTQGSEMTISTTIEGIEEIYKDMNNDSDSMISLFARIWVIDSLLNVCEVEFKRERLEICKINTVAKLLEGYLKHDDPEDAFDLFSFYMAMSRNKHAAFNKHKWIVKNIVVLYRKEGYNERADAIEAKCNAVIPKAKESAMKLMK
jgi:hypothetical protein